MAIKNVGCGVGDRATERGRVSGPILIDHLDSKDAELVIMPKNPAKAPRVFAIHDLQLKSVDDDLVRPQPVLGIRVQTGLGAVPPAATVAIGPDPLAMAAVRTPATLTGPVAPSASLAQSLPAEYVLA